MPLPIPHLGLGLRTLHNYFGIDSNIICSGIPDAFWFFKGSLHGMVYPSKSKTSGLYVGIGPAYGKGMIRLTRTKSIDDAFGPDFVFGKYNTSRSNRKRFFQLQCFIPMFGLYWPDSNSIPLITLSFGWGL